MFKLSARANRHLDQLRPGLLHLIMHRLRALNENTRLLVRLLEEPDWKELGRRVLGRAWGDTVH